MNESLAGVFRRTISQEVPVLQALSEEQAQTPHIVGRWSRKQELGHLIDSAANNHMRFVRAALDGSYVGPSYAQNDWVDLHGYRDLPWAALVEFWRGYNELLVHLVERIPEDKLAAACTIGSNGTRTLGFIIEDYIRHLRHHVDQIAGRDEVTRYPDTK